MAHSGASMAQSQASTSSSVQQAPKPAPTKPTNVWANYTTAKDLGIAAEEEAIATAAISKRQSEGVAGQWEVVDSTATTSSIPQKRTRETQDEDDEEGSGFMLRRKKLATGFGEIYDPGLISLVPKQEQKVTTPAATNQDTIPSPEVHSAPVWTTKHWRTGKAKDVTADEEPQKEEAILREPTPTPPEAPQEILPEEPLEIAPADTPPVKNLFKKRKGPAPTAGLKKGARKQL